MHRNDFKSPPPAHIVSKSRIRELCDSENELGLRSLREGDGPTLKEEARSLNMTYSEGAAGPGPGARAHFRPFCSHDLRSQPARAVCWQLFIGS